MPTDAVTFATVAARPTVVVAQATTWREFPRLWPALLDEVYAVVSPAPEPAPVATGDEQEGAGERWQNVMLYRDACTARGLTITGMRWEVYGHWRADPRALETEVSYLLQPRS